MEQQDGSILLESQIGCLYSATLRCHFRAISTLQPPSDGYSDFPQTSTRFPTHTSANRWDFSEQRRGNGATTPAHALRAARASSSIATSPCCRAAPLPCRCRAAAMSFLLPCRSSSAWLRRPSSSARRRHPSSGARPHHPPCLPGEVEAAPAGRTGGLPRSWKSSPASRHIQVRASQPL